MPHNTISLLMVSYCTVEDPHDVIDNASHEEGSWDSSKTLDPTYCGECVVRPPAAWLSSLVPTGVTCQVPSRLAGHLAGASAGLLMMLTLAERC